MSKPSETNTEEPIGHREVSACLGIESTAHTFSVSIASTQRGTSQILSNISYVYSPPKGEGIHPREASKHHALIAAVTVSKALKHAKISIDDVDAVAFSRGPGLGPCLRVGAIVAHTIINPSYQLIMLLLTSSLLRCLLEHRIHSYSWFPVVTLS
jgi:hypothetical protein